MYAASAMYVAQGTGRFDGCEDSSPVCFANRNRRWLPSLGRSRWRISSLLYTVAVAQQRAAIMTCFSMSSKLGICRRIRHRPHCELLPHRRCRHSQLATRFRASVTTQSLSRRMHPVDMCRVGGSLPLRYGWRPSLCQTRLTPPPAICTVQVLCATASLERPSRRRR